METESAVTEDGARVEEIRQRFADDPSSDNVFDATDVAILLAHIDTLTRTARRLRDALEELEAHDAIPAWIAQVLAGILASPDVQALGREKGTP